MSITLSELVNIAGAALEAEDRSVLGASMIHGEKSGLVRWGNEHFYQYVACRSWLSRWLTIPEKENRHDAAIFIDRKLIAAVEMKKWWSEEGAQEIRGIRSDVLKLEKAKSSHAFMIIFSANPRGQTEKSLADFRRLTPELMDKAMHLYSFNTFSPWGDSSADFWVAGWQIK